MELYFSCLICTGGLSHSGISGHFSWHMKLKETVRKKMKVLKIRFIFVDLGLIQIEFY